MTSPDIAPGPEQSATPSPAAPEASADPSSDLAKVVSTAVREELDGILPHVLTALKRDRAFDALQDRLSRAERRLEARRERPLAVAVHRLLSRLRHLDFDQPVKDSLETELVKVLRDAGFEETGQVGEDYDAARHEALGGRAVDGRASVVEVHARGLSSVGDIIVRAQVRIAPRADSPPRAG